MYYRRGFYPRPGQADVPDDLWAEFQRIRGHLSKVDQNNVDSFSVAMSDIALPDTLDHVGVSDIVGIDGEFLHKELTFQGDSLIEIGRSLRNEDEGRWIDLGPEGALLRGHSRGDAPWIVAASVDFSGRSGGEPIDEELAAAMSSGVPDSFLDDVIGSGHHSPKGAASQVWKTGEKITPSSSRVNFRLRIKTKDGLSAAEAVGGLDNYSIGGSLAVVACSFSGGGPVEFSPAIKIEENKFGALVKDNWVCSIHKVNIFAFGLYK